jgi:hypothetical protein
MGIYAYGLSSRTKTHPLFGEVGIIRFIHKPAPLFADDEWVKQDEKREQYYKNIWEYKDIPKFVIHAGDKDFSTLSFYRGGAVWYDCDEHLCIPLDSMKGVEMLAKYFADKVEEKQKILAEKLRSATSVV